MQKETEKEPATAATVDELTNNISKYKYTPDCGICQAKIVKRLEYIAANVREAADIDVGEAETYKFYLGLILGQLDSEINRLKEDWEHERNN